MLPVDRGHGRLLPAQLRVPVLGRVLVVVAELGLRQERAQLHRLLRAHAQVPVVEVLLHVCEENVPGGQRGQMRGQKGGGNWVIGILTNCCIEAKEEGNRTYS